jgi:uncharacterized protein (DUF427 family)
LKAIWNQQLIAESNDTVVVEGNHYFPPNSVNREFLIDSTTTTFCPWKGTANYYTLVVDGQSNADAAWYYAETKSAADHVRGRIAFWRGVQISES